MSRDLQLRAALVGSMDAEIARGRANVERSLQAAIFEFAEGVQEQWRRDVRGSRLANGARAANTIRLRKYRNEGLNPAALVYTNWPKVMAAFERGGVIRAPSGKALLIPNPDVWPGGRIRRRRGAPGGGRPSAELQAARAKFGELRYVPARGPRPAMLVAEALFSQKTGRFRANRRTTGNTKGVTTIVVFWLVKEVRQPKLLRGAQIRERARRAAPAGVDRLFVRNMNYGSGGAS